DPPKTLCFHSIIDIIKAIDVIDGVFCDQKRRLPVLGAICACGSPRQKRGCAVGGEAGGNIGDRKFCRELSNGKHLWGGVE
ncbi:MAG: hypothetical protein ACRCYP_04685, partial [Alphaproteobacteria bacterium]